MIFRYPAYYDRFHCIADRCEDTCCAGWEIDIDDESYQYYMRVGGEFGRRLRDSIKEYESEDEDVYENHGFILRENKRCPFLNDSNLCDLYRELGEAALCDVCTNTPRNILEYGGERELAVSASCPEAGRLIYGDKERITFVEREIDDTLDFEESEEEMRLAHQIQGARDRSMQILQNRGISIEKRICLFLHYAEAVQECLNSNEPERIEKISMEPYLPCSGDMADSAFGLPAGTSASRHELFLKRMISFTGMESISSKWEEMLTLLQKRYVTPEDGAVRYETEMRAYLADLYGQEREYEYEHLMVYYVFMCLARCVDDYDLLGRARLAVTSFLMIRDMDTAWHAEHGMYYSREDRVRIAGIYAKEVEHSEENLDYLAEEFLFEEAYEIENLCQCVLT